MQPHPKWLTELKQRSSWNSVVVFFNQRFHFFCFRLQTTYTDKGPKVSSILMELGTSDKSSRNFGLDFFFVMCCSMWYTPSAYARLSIHGKSFFFSFRFLYVVFRYLASMQPNGGKFIAFDHITFYVGNAKQAASYYTTRLGFKPCAYQGLETGSRKFARHVVRQNKVRIVQNVV